MSVTYDIRLKLYNGDRFILSVGLAGRQAAETEVAVCKDRIKRGDATHYVVESISDYGSTFVKELRE